jgi:two-component system NtrC family sensor kinase
MIIKVFTLLRLLFLVLLVSTAFAQKSPSDSLKKLLSQSLPDTARVLLLDQLSYALMYSKPSMAMQYAQEGLDLSKKSHFPKGQVRNMNRLGAILRFTSNYGKALEMHFGSLKLAESINDKEGVARTLNNIGILYLEQKDFKKAIAYFRKTQSVAQQIPDLNLAQIAMVNIATNYALLNQLDSARMYVQTAYEMTENQTSSTKNTLLISLGNIYYRMGNYALALKYYRMSLPYLKAIENNRLLSQTYFEMAQVFRGMNSTDSCLYYAQRALTLSQAANNVKYIFEASNLLSALYDSTNTVRAYQYFKLAAAAKDSMFSQEKVKQVQNLSFSEQLRQQELIKAQEAYENRQKIGALLGVLGVFLIVAFMLYRNNLQKQKANKLLYRQKEEINLQRDKAEKALSDLRAAQNQLIQSEKLASLGELMAGIAHEIQNPLNFVNNFSELSTELIEELSEELPAELKTPPSGFGGLLADITQNLQKINHHGKRASSIVKGMLEHSRSSTGVKELTDINKLADEYLRLSYHGLRAKNKAFVADFSTDFDESLPKKEVIPQDMGRVLLNLINNAFYAVNERAKQGEPRYQPKVKIRTFQYKTNNEGPFEGWGLSVSDNGSGIPDAIKSKIFQPFFTTKPTGEGTGLGLSLAYDIITKGHGGTMEVVTQEGEGTTFVVKVPYSAINS